MRFLRLLRLKSLLQFGCALASLPSFASSGAEASDHERLFPPHSTVVLLAGLPGDVESENNYAEQLQAWLEIARASSRARELFILCDNPESNSLQPAESQV